MTGSYDKYSSTLLRADIVVGNEILDDVNGFDRDYAALALLDEFWHASSGLNAYENSDKEHFALYQALYNENEGYENQAKELISRADGMGNSKKEKKEKENLYSEAEKIREKKFLPSLIRAKYELFKLATGN